MAQTQSWMLVVGVPLSKSVCSEVDPAICEPSTEAGLQDTEETICARGFSVSHSQILKIALTVVHQAFPPRVSLWEQITFCTFKSSCWHSVLDLHPELFSTASILSWVLRSVVFDSPGGRGSLVGAALGAAWEAEGRRSRDSPARGKTSCCDCQGSAGGSALYLLFVPGPFPVSEGVRALQVLVRAVGRSGNAAGSDLSGMFSRKPFALVQCCRMWVLDPRCSSQKPQN